MITNGSGLSGGKSTESFGYDFRTDAPQVQAVMVDDDQDMDGRSSLSLEESLVKRRDALLQALAISGGDAQAETFTEKIEPLLRNRCYECHSHEAGKMKGGLTLDSRSGWEEGGEGGPAIVPGQPEESILVEAVRRHRAEGVIFAAPSFCDPALLDRPMLQRVLTANGIPYTAFKFAENSGRMQPIREQAGTFADSIKLWSAA